MDTVQIIKNPTYKKDYNYAFKLNRWFFNIMAIWPDKNHIISMRLIAVAYKIVFVILQLVIIFPSAIELYSNDSDHVSAIKSFFSIYIAILFTLKYFSSAVQVQSTNACIEQLFQDWRYIFEGSREVMMRSARTSRAFLLLVSIGTVIAVLLWHIVSLLKKPIVVDGINYHELPFAGNYYFFDARVEPYYYYVCLSLFFGQCAGIISVIMSCQAFTFTLHASTQYAVLANATNRFCFGQCELTEGRKTMLKQYLKKQYTTMR